MAQKAAAAKRLEKVQREAAMEAVKMAKKERGCYKIHLYLSFAGIAFKLASFTCSGGKSRTFDRGRGGAVSKLIHSTCMYSMLLTPEEQMTT